MATITLNRGPLVAGDLLTRDEFLRRWEEMPDLKSAELLGGVVYMPSPLGADHSTTDAHVTFWLQCYATHTPGCETGSNATWHMLADAPQPDSHLRIIRECGGTSWVKDNYFHGAPELAAEVCRSSTSYDLHQKKELYQSAGVKEYLTVLLEERSVHWHRLVGGRYQTLLVNPDGLICSTVFPGLWLDPTALLAGNMPRVLDILQRGLQSSEHAEFVRHLAKG